MLPCKKILCPIDFSEASMQALDAAKEMVTQFSAQLLLMHVRPTTVLPPDVLESPGFDLAKHERLIAEDVQKKLEELANKRISKNMECRLIVKQGDAGHEILQTATNENVNLIVIATHGMTGWRHYLYGSVAQRVIQHTPCSVLVIRSNTPRK